MSASTPVRRSTSDEAGEVQLVADLIARDDVAGIAISPSNAPAMAAMLTRRRKPTMPIMTIDADLLGGGPRPAHDLSRHRTTTTWASRWLST